MAGPILAGKVEEHNDARRPAHTMDILGQQDGRAKSDGAALLEYLITVAATVLFLTPVLWPYPANPFYKAIQSVYRRAVVMIGGPGL